MKQFFQTTFACVLGIFIAWLLGFFLLSALLIGAAASSISSSSKDVAFQPKPKSIFHLQLDREVVDRVNLDPFAEINNALNNTKGPIGLNEILTSIEKAQYNDNIKGIYLTTDGYISSFGTSTELRKKLTAFKESGKFVISYNNNYSLNQYYLSSVADSLFINPFGSIELRGLSSTSIFFKKTLDKLGVEMQIFRVGTFKSAIEPFTLEKMSEANREQTQTFLNSMWQTVSDGIATSRNLSNEDVNNLANEGILFKTANEITASGLFDKTYYPTDMDSYFERLLDSDDIEMPKLNKVKNIVSPKRNAEASIAILYATGDIVDNKSGGIYWKEMIKEIETIKKDDDIKAVVLRVNSPGGSAFGSEIIWKAIEELKAVKPVVTSMGALAASGGYYISCNSDKIIAEKTTLTGSIGVFGMIPNAQNLLTEKIGLRFDEVKTNTFGSMSIARPLTTMEKAQIQHNVENVYNTFITRCANGRNLSIEAVQKVAEGRVWTGEDALHIGLVDQIGGLDTALEEAAKLAFISSYNVIEYPKEKDFFTLLMEEMEDNPYLKVKSLLLPPELTYIQAIKQIQNESHIQARMINNITIE